MSTSSPANEPADEINPDSDRPGEPAADAAVAYTDGACSGNPGPGGWAWATTDGRLGSGGAETTTNQRMELQAVLEVVKAIDGPIVVYSDSTYVVNCFNDRWFEGWLKKDWKNSQRKPVANRDLWEPLVELYLEREHELSFVWVKGHSGDKMNELVDAMAVAESMEQKELLATGSGAAGADTQAKPQANSPQQPPANASGPQSPWPSDQAIVVTGVAEPDEEQIEALTEAIEGLNPGYDLLITGLRRGVELLAGELAVTHGISLGVVLPFADPASRWPAATLARFEGCVAKAEWVVTLDGDPGAPSKAVQTRNAWLWSAAVGAIVVGDDKLVAELDDLGLGVIPID
ncbi:MAG: RNase H family protein [Acidimicrobiales bacterium]